jgi:hypothetical protein
VKQIRDETLTRGQVPGIEQPQSDDERSPRTGRGGAGQAAEKEITDLSDDLKFLPVARLVAVSSAVTTEAMQKAKGMPGRSVSIHSRREGSERRCAGSSRFLRAIMITITAAPVYCAAVAALAAPACGQIRQSEGTLKNLHSGDTCGVMGQTRTCDARGVVEDGLSKQIILL